MHIGIALIICSLVYSLLILVVYLTKKKVNTYETKLYNGLIVLNLVNLLVELLCCYTVSNIDKMPFVTEVVNRLFLLVILYWQSVFTVYNYSISFKKVNEKLNFRTKIGKIFIITLLIMILGLLFLPLEYYNSNGLVYSYGDSANFLYCIVVVYFISWIIMYAKRHNNKKNRKYLPIVMFIFIMGIALIVRALNPGILIISSSFAFVTNLMFFTIENPDMKLLDELHKSKEISDSANEEKMAFLYNVSQEIRNSTDIVDDYANLILETDDTEEIKDSARNIKAETSKFNSLMNEMFDVSKLDASNIKVYNNKYNVKNILKEVVSVYNIKCGKKTLDFRVNIDHNIPELLYGDSINLKKVLTIILDNSLEYTKSGYIEFNVNTIIKNDVCRLMISIEDSGSGIKGEDINKLKVNNKSFSEANKLITLMSGAINISSDYGYGTKVKIMLDQKMELVDDKEIDMYENLYDNIRMLMVDDSEAGIKIIDKIIKGTNIKMDFAMNGKDCLSKIKNEGYDLILLDEQLTQISAMELIKKIKGIKGKNMPVILLTKDNTFEYTDEIKKIGFDDYILKPVKKKELLKKIDICKKKDI